MNRAAGFGLNRIGQICVNAKDLDRAAVFYERALGMKLLFKVQKMAFFQCGEIQLMLGLPEEPEFDHPSSLLYFMVEEIDGAYATLRERGVEFRGKPHLVHKAADHELWMAFFRDTEGNSHALMCRRIQS